MTDLALWPDPEQWMCRGCGLNLDTPRQVTPRQIREEWGFWTQPPPGWFVLVLAGTDSPVWVCSDECAFCFDAMESKHG